MWRNMEHTERKRLRWKYWNYNNSGTYFLTICTKNREKILSRIYEDPAGEYLYDSDDRRLSVALTAFGKIVEKYLGEASQVKGISVEHYVIMPDHIHIILAVEGDRATEKEPGKEVHERVPKFLSSFKTLCHKAAGEKFLQRSGYDHVIRNYRDYEETVHYINRNPARWYHREIYGTEQ